MPESIHILILEDNPADAELVEFELVEAGFKFKAKVVTTKEDFIHELQDVTPDLILSDYDLPNYNGSLALTESQTRCPDTPFILVTGAVSEDRAIEILTQGAKDYVLKTRLQQRLIPAVQRALTEAEERQARKKVEDELRQSHKYLKEIVKSRTAELDVAVLARKKTEEALRKAKLWKSMHTTNLRRRADERLQESKKTADSCDWGADSQKLLQELQIHQIELEMQNDELLQSQNETDVLLADYLDIFDFAPIGYFTLNSEGVILRANLTGGTLIGVVRSRLTGQSLLSYFSAESYSTFNTFLHKAFEGETIQSCEVKLRNGEGPARFLQLEARLAEDGKKCRLAMIDITERRRMEADLAERTRQLEDANKELESFSYSVSHDLRAPLRAIDGYSRMILKKEKDKFDEDTREKFEVIRTRAQKMSRLIDDLLKFAHLTRPDTSVSKLDMHGLFHGAWQDLQRDNTDRVVTLKIDKLPHCLGDRRLLTQVCIHLLSNAAKFTRQRDVALIEIGGYVKENECIYFVRDNGAGFDMAYQDKLFGVFQRLHSETEYEGTGIGLALVKRIINRHGGRIWAEGKVDEGATFYFTLPKNL